MSSRATVCLVVSLLLCSFSIFFSSDASAATSTPVLVVEKSATSTSLVLQWSYTDAHNFDQICVHKKENTSKTCFSLLGKKNGTITTKELTSGTYEFRYYKWAENSGVASKVAAVSAPVTVMVDPPVLVAVQSPTSTKLSVTWSDLITESLTGWIGVYRPGENVYLQRFEVWGKRTGTFVTREFLAGTYEFRYFYDKSNSPPLSTSNKVTISTKAPTLTAMQSPTSTAINLNWATPITHEGDWIGIHDVSKQGRLTYIERVIMDGKKSGTFTTRELPSGTYEFRYYYLNDDPYPVATSNSVRILAAEPTFSVFASATSSFLNVSWKAPGRKFFLDKIGVYKVGASDSAAVQTFSTNGATAGAFSTNELPASTYELRYFFYDQTKSAVTSLPVQITGTRPILTAIQSATSSALVVTWKTVAPDSQFDRIGLYMVDDLNDSPVVQFYTKNAKAGTFTTDELPSGTYEFRYFYKNQSLPVAVSSSVVVTGTPTTLVVKASSTRPVLTASWRTSDSKSAKHYIGLFRVGAPDDSPYEYNYVYVLGKTSGTFTTKELLPGTYEFRYFADNKKNSKPILTSQSIEIALDPTVFTQISKTKSLTRLTGGWNTAKGFGVSWVGLYRVGDPDHVYIERFSTHGETSGTFTTNELPSGTYEFRYFVYDSYPPLAISEPVRVIASPTSSYLLATSTASSTLRVEWKTPVWLFRDRIGLYRAGAPNETRFELASTTVNAKAGTFTTKSLAVGSYEFRYLLAGMATSPLMVSNLVNIKPEIINPTPLCTNDILRGGKSLAAGQTLQSCNKAHTLTFGTDGNLSLRINSGTTSVWTSGTAGSGATTLTMQADGNLVLYTKSRKAVWSLLDYVGGKMGAGQYLELKNDGTLAVYNQKGAVRWSTSMPKKTTPTPVPPTPTPTTTKPTGTLSVTPCVIGSAPSKLSNRTDVCDSLITWNTTGATKAYTSITGSSPYLKSVYPYGYTTPGGNKLSGTDVPFWTPAGTYTVSLYVNGDFSNDKTKANTGTKIAEKTITVAPKVTTPTTTPTTCGRLLPGKTLTPGQSLTACNGAHTATFTTDGNFTFGSWNSNTAGKGGNRLVMQADGNLVIYAGSKALWSVLSHDGGKLGTGQYLELKDDGTLAVYDTKGSVRWSTTMPFKATGSIAAITPCTVGVGKSVTDPNNAVICDQGVTWTSSNATDVKLVITGAFPYDTANFPNGHTAGTGAEGTAAFWVTSGTYKATLYSGTTKLTDRTFTVAPATVAPTTPATTTQAYKLNQMASVLEAIRALLGGWR